MSLNVQELTKLLTETDKAKRALLVVQDYVDLMNKHQEELSAEIPDVGDSIKRQTGEVETQIEKLKGYINQVLDKMSIDQDEVKNAAGKLLLYQNDISFAKSWIQSQQKRYDQDSYWWRFWDAVSDVIVKEKGKS